MEKYNLFFRGLNVYRVSSHEFAEFERSVEFARVAACHNAWTKKRNPLNYSCVECMYSNYIT